ncbi:tetraspanin-2A [Venturia canescens]|uniref:tetraspanin-2A n=1 Tax=Venturia canescens TaxID=32260 RepID=UPI001C9C84FE|nr:tetraspanin-2A [Venturia canescens]XP_043268592.1 tetraspanin-2A [Venturia canescens]
MVLKSQGTESARLEHQIGCIKYTIFCLDAVLWILGAAMFGMSIWLLVEPGFAEWVDSLDISEFYIGIYVLVVSSIFVMLIAFIGCAAALMEHTMALYTHIGLQGLCFILGLAGSAVLLDYSTYDSKIQPLIRRSMSNLISTSHQEKSAGILRMIQENMGCCGADGPMDYLTLLKPLPTECRDSVTGNAFFHGCIEEFTWFLEARSGWLAGVALALCMFHVILGVLSFVLVQAKQKEEEAAIFKR